MGMNDSIHVSVDPVLKHQTDYSLLLHFFSNLRVGKQIGSKSVIFFKITSVTFT